MAWMTDLFLLYVLHRVENVYQDHLLCQDTFSAWWHCLEVIGALYEPVIQRLVAKNIQRVLLCPFDARLHLLVREGHLLKLRVARDSVPVRPLIGSSLLLVEVELREKCVRCEEEEEDLQGSAQACAD